MFKGTTYRRCACTVPVTDDNGEPVLNDRSEPKVRTLGDSCPQLKKRDHGSWYYYVELPPGPNGKRRRPRKGGFRTRAEAEQAATTLWKLAQGGVDVMSEETVAEYLSRWIDKRVDLKRSTRMDYQDYIDRIFIPALGHLKLVDLRGNHIQEMFQRIWADNEVHAENKIAAQQAYAAERAAHSAWREAAKPRDPSLRQDWNNAKQALRAARSQPRNITGPGTQLKFRNTLSGALDDAVAEKIISEDWTMQVTIPKYTPPKPLVWTPARVKAYRETGVKPGKVMVWTPEQTGKFLDCVAEHRLYPMFHIMIFRGLRRGEACGLPWAETDLELGVVNISEQLVTSDYEVWEDTPKSDSGARTIVLDSETKTLLELWQARQQEERRDWDRDEANAWINSGLVFTWQNGTAYHPGYLSQAFSRLLEKFDLLPVRLHDLRHCAATLSLAAGIHMKAIQVMLGHSSYGLTADTYTSVLPQFEQAQAEAPLLLRSACHRRGA